MVRLIAVEDREEHMEWLVALLNDLDPILSCRLVTTFQDWDEALTYIAESSVEFDVVVTDLQDRDTKRFQGFRIIRAAKKRGKGVVAVSSFLDDPGHMREVLRSGADYYVKKPFKPEWRKWNEYPEELKRSAYLSMYFALRRFGEGPTLLGLAEQHVFISYAHEDEDLAGEIADLFEANRFDTYMAARDITGGIKFEADIREAIVCAQLLVPLITPHSSARAWVLCEVGAAWGLGKPILPAVAFVEFGDLPEVISSRHAQRVETSEQRMGLIEAAQRLVG